MHIAFKKKIFFCTLTILLGEKKEWYLENYGILKKKKNENPPNALRTQLIDRK